MFMLQEFGQDCLKIAQIGKIHPEFCQWGSGSPYMSWIPLFFFPANSQHRRGNARRSLGLQLHRSRRLPFPGKQRCCTQFTSSHFWNLKPLAFCHFCHHWTSAELKRNLCTNPAKMSEGIPLSDADRAPWLESLQDAIRERLDGGEDVAVSCSALQLRYRDVLRAADRGYSYRPGEYAACRVKFVCLRASAEVIAERMLRRSAEGKHFMPASLLRSQLDLLQVDAAEGVTEFDATTVRPGDIVRDTVALFREDLASTVHAWFVSECDANAMQCNFIHDSVFIKW